MMADSASEVDLESDTSSIDGLSVRDQSTRCDQLQRRVDLLQQENRVLKTEVETLKLKVRSLTDANQQLRKNSVSIQAKAEQEEEYISNMLQRRISELKKEKESLALNYEQEEECLTNELNRKLVQLQKEKELLERTLAKEQETQVNKLKRRIEKLESEKNIKQQSLDKLRHEKIELENALEQEQEALVNRLWKKMDKLEAEKRLLQEKLESASAPLSGSSSVQNLAPGPTQMSCGPVPGNGHSESICLATSGLAGSGAGTSLLSGCRGSGSGPCVVGGRSASSGPGSLRSSLRLPTTPMHISSDPYPSGNQISYDNLVSGMSVEYTSPGVVGGGVGGGSLSDSASPCNLPSSGSAGAVGGPEPSGGKQAYPLRPRPPQSPMDLDLPDISGRLPGGPACDSGFATSSLSRSEYSLQTPLSRSGRGSQSNSLSAMMVSHSRHQNMSTTPQPLPSSGYVVLPCHSSGGCLQAPVLPPPPPPPPVIPSTQPLGPPPPLTGGMDSQTVAAYVGRLREEVNRLRALVASNQSEHMARMGVFEREERLVAEENQRLKRQLQAELDRKEAISRQLSGSESSLEMEDERQFNEASRSCYGRFRTTSDSCPSPYHHGGFYGPGYAFASAVAAATAAAAVTSGSSRAGSPRYCRECGQSMVNPVSTTGGGACGSFRSTPGNGNPSPRPGMPHTTPPLPLTPQAPNSPCAGLGSSGGNERFVKPATRAPPMPLLSYAGDKLATSVTTAGFGLKYSQSKDAEVDDDEEDDDRCPTPPVTGCHVSST